MGDFKKINDGIYERLISVLNEKGYEVPEEVNDKIVDMINCEQEDEDEFAALLIDSIELIKKYEIDNMINWFKSEYEDPANNVPYDSNEGGYQYCNGGPYYPLEELQENFTEYNEECIEAASKKLCDECSEWVKIDEY